MAPRRRPRPRLRLLQSGPRISESRPMEKKLEDRSRRVKLQMRNRQADAVAEQQQEAEEYICNERRHCVAEGYRSREQISVLLQQNKGAQWDVEGLKLGALVGRGG